MNLVDIQKEWVSSHEESTKDRLVFRSRGYAFPPARGRMRLALLPEGRVSGHQPGPDDRSQPSAGQWQLDGDELTLSFGWLDGKFTVESVDADVLILRRRA